MKSTFAAALLPLVASAVNAQSSKPAEYTYEIREFSAECNSYSVYCWSVSLYILYWAGTTDT